MVDFLGHFAFGRVAEYIWGLAFRGEVGRVWGGAPVPGMATEVQSGDLASQPPSGPSTPPAPLRHATSSASKSMRRSQGRASNSERTPLLPRIAKAPKPVPGCQDRQERGSYGAIQNGDKTKLPGYEIPIWQVC